MSSVFVKHENIPMQKKSLVIDFPKYKTALEISVKEVFCLQITKNQTKSINFETIYLNMVFWWLR